MRSRLLSLAPLVVALFVISSQPSRAAVQNRITSAVTGNSRVPLEHAVPVRALHSSDLGPAAANRPLTNLSLRFGMTPAQQADLTQLLSDQLNPDSPSYHQWLTPEQFGARFGLSTSDLTKVSSWLSSQGFTITGAARSLTFINFTGTVAQAQNAFGTTLHSLSFNGEQHISNLTNPTLPSAIANVVSSIGGLHDFKVKPRSRASKVKVSPNYTATGNACPTGTSTCYYISPGDFYTIYNVSPLLNNATPINGSGIKIAVMGQTALLPAQVAAFRAAAGLPANAPTTQLYGSSPGVVAGDIDEASLDVEWTGAVAQNASILYVYGPDVFLNSLTQAVDNNLAPIISISYGICETQVNTFYNINSINQILQQANAEGITIVSAAGDSGATDCDTAGLATEGLAVDFPSSSPYVTSAGGTQFSGDVGNLSTYWNTSNSTNSSSTTPPTYTGSAKSYIPESPWNETTATDGLGYNDGTGGGSGGGGASAYFSKPAWQTGLGVPNDGSRDVPDFSLNSGAIHDGTIVCSQGDCTNAFQDSTGFIAVFGGTSVAAPSFAGILALVEQKLGTGPLGNIGPNLYGLASVPNVFHDITSGNNRVYCMQGTPNCSNGGPIGFNAGVGYDHATGLGSVDANQLVTKWTAGVPTGTGSINQLTPLNSATALTAGAAVCGIAPGGSLTFTATVTNVSGASGATPTGNVQFMIDNVPAGAPVALTSGTASYTLVNNSTLALTSGGHNVTAVYLGSVTYSGSKGSLLTNSTNTGIVSPIDVVSATQPDFSITPCTASTAVSTGSTAAPVVLTITPFSGFTGSVNFTVNSDTGDVFNTNFSVKPVVISSSAGVTTSFVLTATETTASLTPTHLRPGSSHRPMGGTPWYAAGSGATLACLVLLIAPRRRRWGALLVVLLSVAVVSAAGCSSSSSTITGGGGGGSTTTPAPRGTYNLTITATSGNLVHSAVLTYTVQ